MDGMNGLNYIANGDYLIPNLTLGKMDAQPLGKYGRMRQTFLREHHPVIFNAMLLSGKLMPHLHEIDETAHGRLEAFVAEQAKAMDLTEQLKAADPLGWVAQMNNLKAQGEECVLMELIYS